MKKLVKLKNISINQNESINKNMQYNISSRKLSKSIDNKSLSKYQKAYYDGMTATEWVLWAKRLTWLYGASESSSENE